MFAESVSWSWNKRRKQDFLSVYSRDVGESLQVIYYVHSPKQVVERKQNSDSRSTSGLYLLLLFCFLHVLEVETKLSPIHIPHMVDTDTLTCVYMLVPLNSEALLRNYELSLFFCPYLNAEKQKLLPLTNANLRKCYFPSLSYLLK